MRLLGSALALFVATAHTFAAVNGFNAPWAIALSCGLCWALGTYWES